MTPPTYLNSSGRAPPAIAPDEQSGDPTFTALRQISSRDGLSMLQSVLDSAEHLYWMHTAGRDAVARFWLQYRNALEQQSRLARDACALVQVARQLAAQCDTHSRQQMLDGINALEDRFQSMLVADPASPFGITGGDEVRPGAMEPPPHIATDDSVRRANMQVWLLASDGVIIDGQPVTGWPNGRAKSLFRFLVARRARPVPREVIMETFWPGVDAKAARNNLNVTVYAVRRMLASARPDCQIVLYEGGGYRLSPDVDVWVDSEAFAKLAAQGRTALANADHAGARSAWEAALDLYRTEYCADERYESWTEETRHQLRELHLQVLDALGALHSDTGDDGACASVTARQLEIDVCNERATRRLMVAHCRLNQRHLALRQFRLLEAALAREYDLAPESETRALHDRIRVEAETAR